MNIDFPLVISGPCQIHTRLATAEQIPAALDELARLIRQPFAYRIVSADAIPRLGLLKPNEAPTEPRFLIHTQAGPAPMPNPIREQADALEARRSQPLGGDTPSGPANGRP